MKFVVKLPQGGFCSSHLDHYYHYSVAGRVYEKKAEVEEETERRRPMTALKHAHLTDKRERAEGDCSEQAG